MNEFEQCISEWADRVADRDKTIAQLKATLAAREGEVDQLNTVLREAGWGQGEIDSAAYTFDKLAQANRKLVAERDAAVQEAGRLKEAADSLTCEVCKMDMQRALKGA